MDPVLVDALVNEYRGLQQEVREIYRTTSQSMVVALAVISLAGAFASKGSPNVVALLVPFLLSTVATYQLNVSAQASALSEHRDRIAERLNAHWSDKALVQRHLEKDRVGSAGTLGAYLLAGSLCVGALIYGLEANLGAGWRFAVLQLLVTLLSVVAMVLALLDQVFAKGRANRALNAAGLQGFEPGDAAKPGDAPWRQARRA